MVVWQKINLQRETCYGPHMLRWKHYVVGSLTTQNADKRRNSCPCDSCSPLSALVYVHRRTRYDLNLYCICHTHPKILKLCCSFYNATMCGIIRGDGGGWGEKILQYVQCQNITNYFYYFNCLRAIYNEYITQIKKLGCESVHLPS